MPVSAVLELAPGDPFKGVRVHGSANAIQVKSMPGISVATINVDDCHDCTGKNLSREGHAAAGSRIVRQEDLPKQLRGSPRRAASWVSGSVRNRLSLLLGENDLIARRSGSSRRGQRAATRRRGLAGSLCWRL